MAKESLGVAYQMKRRSKKMAKGGMVGEEMLESPLADNQPQDDLHSSASINEDIVEAILAKRKFASGGLVENAGQVDDQFEPIDQFSEHGDPNDVSSPGPDMDHEADDQDLVAQILKSRKKRA